MQDTSKPIEQYDFFQKLKSLPFIDALYLYGSRARNDQESRSDIDLAVVCPRATSSEWLQVIDIIEKADTLLKIDCVRFDDLEPDHPLRHHIQKDAKILFERETGIVLKLINLGNALKRLENSLKIPYSKEAVLVDDLAQDQKDCYRDAALQRFEFCMELFWKTLKKVLRFEKVESTTPRDVLKKAYQFHIIDHEDIWLSMLDDRNVLSHVYQEEVAQKVYLHLDSYLKEMKKTYDQLNQKYGL